MAARGTEPVGADKHSFRRERVPGSTADRARSFLQEPLLLFLDRPWERDYQSVGLSSVFPRHFFLRNTTLSAGVSGSWERVDPAGGAPETLTSIPPPGSGGGGDDKALFEDDEGGASEPAESKTTAEWETPSSRPSSRFANPFPPRAILSRHRPFPAAPNGCNLMGRR